MEEIWGPTPNAAPLRAGEAGSAKVLGNAQPGDGSAFKCRGPIQITGRDNYQRFGRLLGLDLISAPERAADTRGRIQGGRSVLGESRAERARGQAGTSARSPVGSTPAQGVRRATEVLRAGKTITRDGASER